MMLHALASPAALALLLFQDDSAAPPSVPVGSPGSALMEMVRNSGPVAFAPSNPQTAYVVGFDRVLYRSADRGASWAPVGGGSR